MIKIDDGRTVVILGGNPIEVVVGYFQDRKDIALIRFEEKLEDGSKKSVDLMFNSVDNVELVERKLKDVKNHIESLPKKEKSTPVKRKGKKKEDKE